MSISLMVSFFHFHLLLCNCLILSLIVFCGKSNKVTSYKLLQSNSKTFTRAIMHSLNFPSRSVLAVTKKPLLMITFQ